MNVSKPRPRIFESTPIVMPANLKWVPGTEVLITVPDYFQFSMSWDGHAECWRVPAPVKRTPTSQKPRMWRENGLWHCQHPDSPMRGSGTTMRYAYKEQRRRSALYTLVNSGARITIHEEKDDREHQAT